jgi:hypothetical protein
MKIKRFITTFCITVLAVFFLGTVNMFPVDDAMNPVADVNVGSYAVTWQPKVEYRQLILSVSGPGGLIYTRTFEGSSAPYYDLSAGPIQDGIYTYELRVIPNIVPTPRTNIELAGTTSVIQKALTQTGSFLVKGGSILLPQMKEGPSRTMDVLHYDDVIITGSLCVGFDCVNGESFGYDTVKLKENNLRLYFEDTSAGSFPSGDWRIRINDTTSGGASYFAVEDGTNGRTPFRIETGAPNHSLYVEDYGRVGLGTSIPYVELHIVDGDSPTIRLDQDGSSGWTAQRWDLCGNETNFFIRDVTNGSKLCFRIQPNTPSSTLCLKSNGNVGIGTWSPAEPLEVETTGKNSKIWVERTDGATGQLTASASNVQIGAASNHPVRIVANGAYKMEITAAGRVNMAAGGGYYDNTNGDWVDGSSREYKENIAELETEDALAAFKDLKPVTFKFKTAPAGDKQVGFIAEDVPELVAKPDRKGLSPMDIVAVLTKVVQEQQKTITQLQKEVSELKKEIKK